MNLAYDIKASTLDDEEQILGMWVKLTRELNEHYYGRDHLKTARARSGLANLYLSEGKYAEAEPLYRWVLGVCSDTSVGNNRCIYQMLINLGLVYRKLGKYAVSEQHFQDALNILEASNQPNAHGLASALQGLAATYLDWDRPDEALHRPELRRVNHDGTITVVRRCREFQLEPFG